jgi:NTP pyrophosphatase (non-canonical NTP hydrolase)
MISREQLLLLAGSVNEAIEDWEFSTRLGAEKDDARRLREELGDLIARLGPWE